MKVKGKHRNLVGIDLFAGAGGMSLGAQMAGISVQIAVELEQSAFRTYTINHPDTVVLQADAQAIENAAFNFESKNLIVFGGPPCQGFSTSNQRTRGKDNRKNWLYQSFIKFVRNVRPGWVVFENVRGILETESGHFAKSVEEDLQKLGYDVTSGLLNAADFGIPQVRSRFFVIGRIEGKAPSLPVRNSKRRVTVSDAISDLPILRNGSNRGVSEYRTPASTPYARKMRGRLLECSGNLVSKNAEYVVRRYQHIPKGGNWADIPSHMMKNYADKSRCHTGIYKRLREDEPSVVIGNFRKNMLIHPTQSRGLSVREAARLQSFPDWYEFAGSIGLQQQQVGNAVPPLLAKAIFQEIVKSHKRKKANERGSIK